MIVNVLAFLAFTVDFFVSLRNDKGLVHPFILNIFAIVGGGFGMLVAFLVWDRKVRKANVAWRFVAIGGIVVWALIIINVYGPNKFSIQAFVESLSKNHVPLLIYLALINIATLIVFVVDKIKAIKGKQRIREFVLLGMSMLGGALGGIIGMAVARHKINTYYFKFGLPIMLVIDLVVIAYLMQAGIV